MAGENFEDCEPPVVLDEGTINRIFLYWVSTEPGHCLSDGEFRNYFDYAYQGYFLKNARRYSPCVISHVLYNGNVVNQGQIALCNGVDKLSGEDEFARKADAILEKYVGIQDQEWSEWLEYHKPLSVDFDEVYINKNRVSGNYESQIQEIIEIKSNPNYRLLIPTFSDDSLVDGWEAINTGVGFISDTLRIRKSSRNEMESLAQKFINIRSEVSKADKDSLLRLNQAFQLSREAAIKNQISDSIQATFGIEKAEVQMLDLTQVCKCQPLDSLCIDSCKKFLELNPLKGNLQDYFHARQGCNSTYLNPSIKDESLPNSTAYLKQLCSDVMSVVDPLRGINGGNFLVTKEYLFMGKDELIRLIASKERRNRLERGLEADTTLIEKALLQAVFSDSSGKHVVWLGNSKPVNRYADNDNPSQSYYQPIFHVDLFFQPLGRFGEDSVLHILFAIPDSTNGDTVKESIQDSIRTYLQEVKRNMMSELMKYDSVSVIELPLQLEINSNDEIENYSNFLNGLIEVDSNRIRFLQPVGIIEPDYKRIQRLNFNRILHAGIPNSSQLQIDTVPGVYDRKSGLRCRVKVLGREN